jgi:L-alanine-DL-glutamate epimerase-like enolase superfamily enzyme
MIIEKIDIYTLNVPYIRPLKIAIGVIDGAQNVVIKITTDTGLVGWGEASPCASILGDTQQTAYQSAQTLAKVIVGKDPLAIEHRMREINVALVGESATRCAFDMALYDIAAKAAKMPLY